MVTECGAAFDDVVSEDGTVHDTGASTTWTGTSPRRCDAIAAGVPLRGFFVWSLLDNFEWAQGYAHRFGLIRVEFDIADPDDEGQRAVVPRVPGAEREPPNQVGTA